MLLLYPYPSHCSTHSKMNDTAETEGTEGRRRRAAGLLITTVVSWIAVAILMFSSNCPVAGLVAPAFPVFTIPELIECRWYGALLVTITVTCIGIAVPFVAMKGNAPHQLLLTVLGHIAIVAYMGWNGLLLAFLLA